MPPNQTSSSKKLHDLYLSCGILKGWHTKTFDEYENDNEAKRKVIRYAEQHKKAMATGAGVYLYGDNGVGKTHLAMCLAMQLIRESYKVVAVTMGTLMDVLAGTWGGDHEAVEFLRRIKKCHFLILEEPGKEIKKGNNTLALNVLDSVFRYRVQNKAPIIITSNEVPEDMAKLYTEDLASMLCELCMPVLVRGVDYRPILQQQNIIDFDL
jgi:DNA replication protein DnaC